MDPTDYRAQERAKADKATLERLVREMEESDLKWLMGSKRGRRIVWRILEKSRVFQLSFNTNALVMSFQEGQRRFGNEMLATINAVCPELYPVMAREAKHERNVDDGNS